MKAFVIAVPVDPTKNGWQVQIQSSIEHRIECLMGAPVEEWQLVDVPEGYALISSLVPTSGQVMLSNARKT